MVQVNTINTVIDTVEDIVSVSSASSTDSETHRDLLNYLLNEFMQVVTIKQI